MGSSDGATFLLLRIEPRIEENQEDPLGPSKVLAISRGENSFPVIAEAEHLELARESSNILFRLDARRGIGLDRMFFGGQSKGVKAHGVQDAFSSHASETADDVGSRVPLWVPDVQAFAARIGKHVENIKFAACRELWGPKDIIVFPVLLPFGFDCSGIVSRHGVLKIS